MKKFLNKLILFFSYLLIAASGIVIFWAAVFSIELEGFWVWAFGAVGVSSFMLGAVNLVWLFKDDPRMLR